MKRSSILFLLLLISVTSWAQDFGYAVQDQINSPLINPAAMGAGNASGLGYSQRFIGDDTSEQDFDLVLSLGKLGYSYGYYNGVHKNLIAGGISTGPGVHFGASYQWYTDDFERKGGLGLSTLLRPSSWLSLAVVARDLNRDPHEIFGLGIRPLFFSAKGISRLTLSWDSVLGNGSWENQSLGAFIEPVDGFKVFGEYDFQNKVFQIGASLVFSLFEAGFSGYTPIDMVRHDGTLLFNASFLEPRSNENRYLSRDIEYDLVDTIIDAPVKGYKSAFSRRSVRSLLDFIRDMEELGRDPSVKTIIFRNQSFHTSFANLLEIEELLKEVKETGKKIYFYYDSMENFPYALAASVGDGIYLSPPGRVRLRGFSLNKVYLKEFLHNWGIRIHNYRSHESKSVFNFLSESEMSEAERVNLETLYSGLHGELVRMLGNRSERLSASPKALFDKGPYFGSAEALEMGLIDGIVYEDEFNRIMEEKRINPIRASHRLDKVRYDWENASAPTIAVIYALGDIRSGEGTAGRTIGAESIIRAVREIRTGSGVMGIILRINSGGGEALASDLIAREIALCGEGEEPIPVVVSMGGTSASGAYYISAPASKIIASPGTVTGSIGVTTIRPEISGLLEKLGIGTGTVKTSENADAGSVLNPPSSSEQEQLEEYISDAYRRFASLVERHREMEPRELEEAARGRIWTGRQARELGLVDETGGFRDAFTLMREILDLDEKKELHVVEIIPGRTPGILERLVPFPFSGMLSGSAAETEPGLPGELSDLLETYKRMSSYRPGDALYMMPYSGEELGVSP